jgi:hypothetical protein
LELVLQMSNRENEAKKRPRSLLSFAGQPDEPAGGVTASLRHESELERYHRMRALRLAAASENLQRSWPETARSLTPEEAEQEAVDRMRADMAAIKAQLNRRVDEEERIVALRSTHLPLPEADASESDSAAQSNAGETENPSLPDDVAAEPVEALPTESSPGAEAKMSIRPLRWFIVAVVIIGTLFSVDKGIILPVGVALGIALILGILEASQIRKHKASIVADAPGDHTPPPGGGNASDADLTPPSVDTQSRLGAAIRQVKDRTMTLDEATFVEPRMNDNSNIEAMLEDIAEIREALNCRAAG